MRDKFHNVLDWVGLFAILVLLVAILGYGHVQVIVERTVQEVSEGYEQDITALLMGAIRADRFSEGALLYFFETGTITKWLNRLKEIDEKKSLD